MITVVAIPIGDVKDALSALGAVSPQISFQIGPAIDPPEEGYSRMRRQYQGRAFLDAIRGFSGHRVIGLTDADMYEGDLNFIFGLAEINGRVCVVSTARLRHPSITIFHERVKKEVLHELGHTFGLHHCKSSRCVMRFSNTLAEVDAKGVSFCPDCLTIWNNAIRLVSSEPQVSFKLGDRLDL